MREVTKQELDDLYENQYSLEELQQAIKFARDFYGPKAVRLAVSWRN